ncbi:DUF3067 family protein [filamentous cyanobacterium LEGE 11480]|uniref:DUF3067 family protein n=2 Tax=Romeriopsis TaxID=2992131 RepID=A0A928VP27_9CYAN|nr:DUF3067 family protein [Romeriopsis navalis LEGE 11480]
MTGRELRQLLIDKWGFSYDIQLRKVKGKIFVQVMWRYLEQASFTLSEEDYIAHLNSVLSHLESWGAVNQVTEFVAKTKEKPRTGKAVSIPIALGERASEWILDF